MQKSLLIAPQTVPPVCTVNNVILVLSKFQGNMWSPYEPQTWCSQEDTTVKLGKSSKPSEPHFPHLQGGDCYHRVKALLSSKQEIVYA